MKSDTADVKPDSTGGGASHPGDDALRDWSLGDALRDAALHAPDRIALVDGVEDPAARRRWTYRELLSASEQVARALLRRFEPGSRIAICAPNCPEWILLQHGVSLAGMVLVPLNPAYRCAELRAILEDSGAAALFYQDRWRNNDIAAHVSELCGRDISTLHPISMSQWDAFRDEGRCETQLPVVAPGDPVIIQFTSGTTGRPKGAVLGHRGFINPPRFVAQRVGFREGGVWINAMPMYHIGGSAVSGLACLNFRGTFVLMREWNPVLTLELVEAERGNGMLLVPTMILALLDEATLGNYDLGSLEFILTGAAAVAPSLLQRVRAALGCHLLITFGQTEAAGTVSTTAIGDGARELAETLGKPLPHEEISIRDHESGAPLPVGDVGEIWFRGYQIMLGYYGRATETQGTITADGWLRSGDLGAFDSQGYLAIRGRLKDLIIRGGMNIYPREIEDVLIEHEAVFQVAVIGLPDEKWGEIVVAIVQPSHGMTELPLVDLHQYCRLKLSPHKAPAFWAMTQDFPLTPSGKIQKFVLQEWIQENHLTLVPTPIANLT